MSAKSDATRWGSVAKIFHWTIALFVIGLLVGGLTMTDMKVSPDKFKLYALHKSIGISILALVLLRLSWRLYAGAPAAVPRAIASIGMASAAGPAVAPVASSGAM